MLRLQIKLIGINRDVNHTADELLCASIANLTSMKIHINVEKETQIYICRIKANIGYGYACSYTFNYTLTRQCLE